MRKLIVSLVALVFAGCVGQSAAPIPGAQAPASTASLSWRFIGLDALKAKTNLVVFRDAAATGEYEGMKSNLATRVAERMAAKAVSGESAAELQKLLMPIAADLVQYPSIFEKEPGASNICSLAVKIPKDRHDLWQANWDGILKATKIPNAKLTRDNDWTLVSNGSSKSIIDRARSPMSEVLQFDGDASILQKILPALSAKQAKLRVTPQGNGLRTEGSMTFDKDLPYKLEAWKIPTNTIREPLVGFTAVQGGAERLGKLDIFKKFKAPNQVFVWSADETPFSTYASARIDDSTNFVHAVADALVKRGKVAGQYEMNTNLHRLTMKGLPVVMPFIGVARNDPGYVMAGAIPVENPSSRPLPAELSQQVAGRTDLLYYDWELTGERVRQVKPLAQAYSMALSKPLPLFQGAADKWLQAMERKIGNTITEVSMVSSRELKLVRRSDLGFSAFELFLLTQWISGPQAAEAAPAKPQ